MQKMRLFRLDSKVVLVMPETNGTGASPALAVSSLSPVLRGRPGRNPGGNGGTTRHLSGLSFRVLAFHLRRAYGDKVGKATKP